MWQGVSSLLEIPTDSCHFFCTPGNPCATPIVTRGEGSFSYQGVSTSGVRHSPELSLLNPQILAKTKCKTRKKRLSWYVQRTGSLNKRKRRKIRAYVDIWLLSESCHEVLWSYVQSQSLAAFFMRKPSLAISATRRDWPPSVANPISAASGENCYVRILALKKSLATFVSAMQSESRSLRLQRTQFAEVLTRCRKAKGGHWALTLENIHICWRVIFCTPKRPLES